MECHPDIAHQLDFDSILTILSEFCITDEGGIFIAERSFIREEETINNELILIQEARELVGRIKPFSTDDFPAVATNINKLSDPNEVLTPIQLYQLAKYLSSVSLFRARVIEQGASERFQELLSGLEMLDNISEHILSVIDEDGNLIIANIDILDTLQQQRMDTAREIENELKSIYRRNTTYYQSPNPVIRNNRLCLALNTDFLGKVPSVVIDQSTSNNTLFIEPLPCVQTNNRWIRQNKKFEHECQKFLKKLTGELKSVRNQLTTIMNKFAFLDSIFARAQFSQHFDCRPVKFTSDNIVLHQARHPLIGTAAVPIDISPAHDCHITVVSGPNGGGKTTTLKTIGLMVLMQYFAMHLPVEDGSQIPHCDHLLLIIGDQQSILEKQSSFTAYMQQLCKITTIMNERSIVLLDELGGNTDPEEGVALAQAVISHCVRSRSYTCITTHFSQLKDRAIQHEQMELIAMEYDNKRNRPRFIVTNGVAEGSHALQVAKTLGLNTVIIEEARGLLNSDAVSYKNLLATVMKERQEQLHQKDQLLQQEINLKSKERAIKQRENEIHLKHIAEIEKLISSSRSQLERLIMQVRERGISLPTKQIHSELQETSAELSEQVRKMRKKIDLQEPDHHQNSKLQIGSPVYIENGMQPFTITKLVDTHSAEVSNGRIRLKVSLSRLTLIEDDHRQAHRQKDARATIQVSTARKPFSKTVDIRGKRAEEIEAIISQKIDSALYNQQHTFAIIHGIGSGALQAEVANILNQNKERLSWRYAEQNDGGRGKTIVTLRESLR